MLNDAVKKTLTTQPLAVLLNAARSLNNAVAYYFYGYWFSQRRA